MKTLPRLLVFLMALCSIGADQKSCAGSTVPPTELWRYCYTDPPVGCKAYCFAVHHVEVTPACFHPSAGPLTKEFEVKVNLALDVAEAEGVEVCPRADSSLVATPCDLGIFPQEWPDQDHDVCTPAPVGCL